MKLLMKQKLLLPITILFLFSFALNTDNNVIEYYQQKKKVSKLLKEIHEKEKVSILYFYADWCRACKAFKKNLSDDLVKKSIENAVLIKINIDEDKHALLKKYSVTKVPTFVKVNKKGKIIAKITSAKWDDDIPKNTAPVMDTLINEATYDWD